MRRCSCSDGRGQTPASASDAVSTSSVSGQARTKGACMRCSPDITRQSARREPRSGVDAVLALSVLHKRALSSAWSLARSVERRLAELTSEAPANRGQMALPLARRTGRADRG